ncbi:MAG: choice-of-anchor D domain-containing protein [Bacteroidota bacterium]|nr:choice-of-anchor D domain-containing protein [Bacteroidota bacterium]
MPTLSYRTASAVLLLVTLPLMGVAQLRIATDRDTVDFTKVKFGYSRDATIRVLNISTSTVDVNTMTIVDQNSVAGEFQIIVPQPTTYHIDSGDGRSVILRFRPSSSGIRTAALEIFTDDGIKEVILNGEGSTIQPDILVVPQSIDFGMLAPGEFKDTTILVIGGDKDSATIQWINVANDNGEIDFDVAPLDPNVSFPIGIKTGDTIVLNARFIGQNFSGPRTGRATMEGEVSGGILCLFRGAVGIPDMVFTPQLLDLGVVPQGSSVDTFISISSIGESSVKLQKIDPPNPPYSISQVPSFPYSVAPGDSLKIGVHFTATNPGDFEEGISAYSKNGKAQTINRSALLKAIVIPSVLTKQSPTPFVVSCAVDSQYQRILSISDTGIYQISVSGVACSDPDIKIQYPRLFPDTIRPGESRNIVINYDAHSNSSGGNHSLIVDVLTGGRVVIADTVRVIVQPETAKLAIARFVSQTSAYIDDIGIVTQSDIARYKISNLTLAVTIDPSDVAEIDTQNVVIDQSIFPDATAKTTFDRLSGIYSIDISSTTLLPSSPLHAFVHIPIKYYIAKDSSAILRITTSSSDEVGCLGFEDDSITISSSGNCGDGLVRKQLKNTNLFTVTNVLPNPVRGDRVRISFTNADDMSMLAELADITGKRVLRLDAGYFLKGLNTTTLKLPSLASGEYNLHLIGKMSDGKEAEMFETLILAQ